eukprot:gene682-64596_t
MRTAAPFFLFCCLLSPSIRRAAGWTGQMRVRFRG